jgi:hypothetical protein
VAPHKENDHGAVERNVQGRRFQVPLPVMLPIQNENAEGGVVSQIQRMESPRRARQHGKIQLRRVTVPGERERGADAAAENQGVVRPEAEASPRVDRLLLRVVRISPPSAMIFRAASHHL